MDIHCNLMDSVRGFSLTWISELRENEKGDADVTPLSFDCIIAVSTVDLVRSLTY